MIPLQNLHTHTVFDDGKNSPDEMAEAAIRAGLSSLGFSGHSTVPYSNDWTLHDIPGYLSAVKKTQEKYAGHISIYNGLEWDLASKQDTSGFDYIIGSIHHIEIGDEYPSIDDTETITCEILHQYYQNDAKAMIQAYFSQYKALAGCTFVDIVGHFDLISKFNLFDESAPYYIDSAMEALNLLAKADKIFEVNTGAMSRGYRTVPYPSPYYLKELKARNARILISSDSHSYDTIAYAFPEILELLQSIGFHEIWQYTESGFQPISIV